MGNDQEHRPVQLEYQSRYDLARRVRESLTPPVLLIAVAHFAISFLIVTYDRHPRPEWMTWVLQALMPQRWAVVLLMRRGTEVAARTGLFLALLGPAVSVLYGIIVWRALRAVFARAWRAREVETLRRQASSG